MPDATSPLIGRREAQRRAALAFGAALTAPTIAAVLAGCEARSDTAHWRPRALDEVQADLLGAVVDHIIPPTDTPGARDAGVPQFIDVMLAEYYTPSEREEFLAGLRDIDARARRRCGGAFLSCAQRDQRALLEQIDRETFASAAASASATVDAADASRETERGGAGGPSGAGMTGASAAEAEAGPASASVSRRSAPRPFFRTLKELTITGYYTSKIGATVELHYLPVPGHYEGCVPLARIGRSWAV